MRIRWTRFLRQCPLPEARIMRQVGGCCPAVTLRLIESKRRQGKFDDEGYAVRMDALERCKAAFEKHTREP